VNTLTADIHLRLSPAFHLECSFEVPPGFTVLFGHSGAGKTSVLDCIAGIKTPDSGRISADKQLVFSSAEHVNRRPEQRRIAYVFQSLALFPHLTVMQNVSYGIAQTDHCQENCAEMLSQFGIEAFASRLPAQLSGGERQRVALARSLVTNPLALLLDEPLAALDRPKRMNIIDDLRRWNEAHQVPILYVTHSVREAIVLGERVLLMQGGRIVADGRPAELLKDDDWE
jgi:molybdate transport system ATP-binding protein